MSQQIVCNCVKAPDHTDFSSWHKKICVFFHQAWSRPPCPAWTGKSKRTTRSWSRLKTWPDRWADSREPRRSASPSLMSTTTHHASPRVSPASCTPTHTHTHTHTHRVTSPHGKPLVSVSRCQAGSPPSGVSIKMNLDYCRELWVFVRLRRAS